MGLEDGEKEVTLPQVSKPGAFFERAVQAVSRVEVLLNEMERMFINVVHPLDSGTASCRLYGRLTVGSALNVAELSVPGKEKEDVVDTIACIDVVIKRLLSMRRLSEIEQIVKRVKRLESYYRTRQDPIHESNFDWFRECVAKWYLQLALAMKTGDEKFGETGLVAMSSSGIFGTNFDYDRYDLMRCFGIRLDAAGIESFFDLIEARINYCQFDVPKLPVSVVWKMLKKIGSIILGHPLLTEDQKKRMQQIMSAFYARYSALLESAPQATKKDTPAVQENEEIIDKPTFAESASVGLIESMDGWDRVEGYAGVIESLQQRGRTISPFIARRAKRSLAVLGQKM